MTSDVTNRIQTDTFSIVEVAELIGKSDQTVRKYIKDDLFPGARMAPGLKGDEWRIPGPDVVELAHKRGWSLQIDQSSDQSSDGSSDAYIELVERHASAQGDIKVLTSEVASLVAQLERTNSALAQARNDVEQHRSEVRRLESDVSELDKARAVAEARTDEIRKQLFESNEAASARAEALTTELREANAQNSRIEVARQQATAEADQLRDSLGWWARRRLEKRTR